MPIASAGDEPAGSPLAAIESAWKQRQGKTSALRYEMAGKWVTFPPDAGAPFGPPGKTPVTRRIERTLVIDWPTGRYRKETKEQTDTGYEAWTQTFSGEAIKGRRRLLLPNGDPDPGFQEKVGIGEGSFKHATFSADYWPVFFAGGVVPATLTEEYYPGHLRFPVQTDMMTVRGTERVDGRACTVLKTFPTGPDKRSFEIVVDPSREGAIVRFTGLIGDRTRFLTLAIRWQHTAFGWQPAGWRHELFRHGAVAVYHELPVSRIESPMVSKADFDIAPAENELVVRRTVEPKNGGTITDQSIFQQRDGRLVPVEIVDGQVRRVWTWRTYILLASAGVAVCGLFLWLQGRRRRGAAA